MSATSLGGDAAGSGHLLVLGLGYSASAVVRESAGLFNTITATRRETGAAPAGVTLLAFEGTRGRPSPELTAALARATHLLVSIPPDREGDPVLRHLEAEIRQAPSLAWIGYLSTVGVYGDAGGAWVDEATPPQPESERAVRRVAVEQAWQALAEGRQVPLQIFRLAGIYGPGRGAVANLKAGTAHRLIKPGQVFNRIHVQDIAGAVLAGMAQPEVGPLINVADDEPAPPQDVVSYAASLMGVEPPPEQDFATAALSPMARSFYAENRRVANRRLRNDLGYSLAHPTYREGIRDCLEAELSGT